MAKVPLCNILVEETSLPDIIDLLARRYGYRDQLFNENESIFIPNPESKECFVKRTLKELIQGEISAQKKSELVDIDDEVS